MNTTIRCLHPHHSTVQASYRDSWETNAKGRYLSRETRYDNKFSDSQRDPRATGPLSMMQVKINPIASTKATLLTMRLCFQEISIFSNSPFELSTDFRLSDGYNLYVKTLSNLEGDVDIVDNSRTLLFSESWKISKS